MGQHWLWWSVVPLGSSVWALQSAGGGRLVRCHWDWIAWATFLCGIFPNARHTCGVLLLLPLLWLCPCHSRSPGASLCDMPKTVQNCRNPLFFIVWKCFQVWKRKEKCKSFHEVSVYSVFCQGLLFQLYIEACILMAPLSFSIKSNLSAKEVKFVFQYRSGCPPAETFNSISGIDGLGFWFSFLGVCIDFFFPGGLFSLWCQNYPSVSTYSR